MTDGGDAGQLRRDALESLKAAVRSTAASAARKVGSTGKEALEVTRTKIDDGFRAVTFAEHRQEVEETLSEITDVLVALDARLTALERRFQEPEQPK